MQKFIFIIAVFVAVRATAAPVFVGTRASAAPVAPVFTRADLVASGLTCSLCSNSIYKALVALPFIAKVTPDVENSSFRIFFRPGTTPDIDALSHAVIAAGFSVARMTLTLDLDHIQVQNDTQVVLGGLTFRFLRVTQETLNGETTLRVVDKDFLPSKEYRRYAVQAGHSEGTRIYHVTI
jgi:hypothetical protein